jgi:transposase
MTPMTGAELQAARRAAAERYTAIGLSYVPDGYTVEYRKSLSGKHYGQRKLIQAPRPVTRKALYIFLHECAHAQLRHSHNSGKIPRHVEELQAEQWAHARMREHGIAVPRAMTKRAKRYVARKIKHALRSGAKRIDPAAKRFAS